MKKLIFAAALLCITAASYSQLRLGILAGPHAASVKEKNSIPDWETKIKPGYSSRGGLHLGVLVEIPIAPHLFLQPGLMYMAKGRKFYLANDTATSVVSDTISTSSNLSVNYIEAPVNLAYKYSLNKKTRLTISAGPYVGFFYNGRQKYETRVFSSNSIKNDEQELITGNDEGSYKTMEAGLNARAGVEIDNFFLTGFLSQGLTNFYHATYEGTFKHRVRGVSVGVWLNHVAQKPKLKSVTLPVKSDTLVTLADTDGDGIGDNADACPAQAGPPEFNGCPIPDSDGDSLNDKEDKCPHQPGPKNNNGCPQSIPINDVEKQISYAAHDILFNANSEQLTINSTDPLDRIVLMLLSNPTLRVAIEGHTDASGKPEINKALSRKRAEAVKNYLIQNGISESRLEATGFGSERPISSNKTAEGRIRNRRVDIRILY